MDTKLIVRLLLSNHDADVHIAWGMVRNDEDLFEFCWIAQCLYDVDFHFMHSHLDILNITKFKIKINRIFKEIGTLMACEDIVLKDEILNDFK